MIDFHEILILGLQAIHLSRLPPIPIPHPILAFNALKGEIAILTMIFVALTTLEKFF